MSYVIVEGGNRLEGEVLLQGSKNGTLPILAASVLCKGQVTLRHCPRISDVTDLLEALSLAGVKSRWEKDTLYLDAENGTPVYLEDRMAQKTRGGVLFLGAFLGRFGEASMAYPGGCVIGARPIDLHCKVFRSMQVALEERPEGVYAKGRPKGCRITLSYPSVGATENAVLAAACGEGITEIFGAAKEPEVETLCEFINRAGGCVSGGGSDRIVVKGVKHLHGTEYEIPGDRIVAGTYLCAAAMTGGEVIVNRTRGVCMAGITNWLERAGLRLFTEQDRIGCRRQGALVPIKGLVTAPHPGFPTDMQSQMIALLCAAPGESSVTEMVFESRFGVVTQLCRMGAGVKREGDRVLIRGGRLLHGASVKATDLRSGAALITAALAAEGRTILQGYEFVTRGYERICEVLGCLGAKIKQGDEILTQGEET